jgi:hypothetical protein
MAFRMDAQVIESHGHLDASQSVFFARELEEIDGQMYEIKYAKLEAFELVPTKKLDPGTETYTYRQWDGRGVAVMTSNYATSSPRADVDGSEFTSKVRSIRNSYGYNVQEIRAAAKEKRPLENMRAVQARRGINEKINRTALLGDAAHGIVGLFNQPNVQTYTPCTKTGGGTAWTGAGATPDEILNDMYGIVDQVPTNTNEIEKITLLLIPYTRLRFISAQAPMSNSATRPHGAARCSRPTAPDVEIRGALFLDTAGRVATARALGYAPRPVNLELLVPMPFESFPPQMTGLEWVVENHARMGGVVVRFPLAMIYATGSNPAQGNCEPARPRKGRAFRGTEPVCSAT